MCGAEDEQLAAVGRSIHDAAAALAWTVDDGQYYSGSAPVGDSGKPTPPGNRLSAAGRRLEGSTHIG